MKLDENAVLTFRSCLLQCHKTNLKLLQDSSARKVFLVPELQNEFVCETSCEASVYYIEINVFSHFGSLISGTVLRSFLWARLTAWSIALAVGCGRCNFCVKIFV
jgi:hypothetical protein